MKKSKILSLILALAMVLSLLPTAASAADTNVIYSEDFNGKTTDDLKAQGYTIEGGDNLIVIENDKVVAKTSVGGVGFNFSSLSAEAKGLVRVKYDVNLYNNAFDVNKSKLFTDGADIPLIAFGAYGSISQEYDHTTWTGTNKVEGVGYGTHWYNVDLLLDFDKNTITVNMKNLDNGTMAISDHVWNYDLSGINTIKGFYTYGWTHGNVADTGYDNLLIEYVTEETPDEPVFDATIYEENFDGKVLTDIATLDGTGLSIVDGAATGNPTNGTGAGYSLSGINAPVANAPVGQIRVKFDFNSPDTQAGASTINLQTNAGEVRLISYGVWNCLRVSELGEEFNTGGGTPGFAANTWYVNDIVLDFDNDQIIYNVSKRDNGEVALNFVRDVDLSAVTSVTSFKFYGWAGAAKLDNLLIEYVTEETPDTPDEPDVPVTEGTIYEENFDGKTTADLKAQGYTIEGGDHLIVIENDKVVAKTSVTGTGFNFNFLSAEAKGLVRVKYDVNLYSAAFDVNKSKLFTDGADIPLMAFGAYGSISQDYDHTTWTATLNKVEGVGYGTHWYNVDLLLDFDNNTITVNMKNLDDDTMAISDLVWNYDLSGINTIKGFYTYGWTHGNVADTGYDNLLIEYVTEETPDVPVTEGTIYEENFDGKTTADLKSQGYTIEGGDNLIVIENDKVVAKTSETGTGFNFNFLSAEAKGLVRVSYDVNLYSAAFDVNKSKLLTDGADIPLIAFGAYGSINQDYDHTSWSGTNHIEGASYGTAWYNVDLLLDFDNNTITVNMENLDAGSKIITDHVWNYDLSGINTIKGFYTYGWTHGNVADTGYDNLLIEYVTEETPDEPEIPGEFEITIYEEDFEDKTTADLKAQGYTIDGGDHLIVIEDGKAVAKTTITGTGFKFGFLSAAANGLVRVSYDVNLYSSSFDVNKMSLKTDAGNIPLMAFGAYGSISQEYDHTTWTGTNKIEGASYGTAWYNVDLLLDFDNNTITVNIKNLDEGSIVVTDHVWNYDLSNVNIINGLESYGWTHGNVADTGYDNLLIEYASEDPVLSSDSIKIYSGDVVEKHSSVNPGADKIVIDFVGVLKASSLENAVTIKNVTDDADVTYTAEVKGSKYIITLDEGLAAKKNFTLTVSGDVENIFGTKLGADYTLNFATNEGYIKILGISLTQNDSQVANLAGLVAGQDAKVKVDFEKTSNDVKNLKLIYAYYNGTELVKSVVKTVTVGADDKIGSKEDTTAIESLSGITHVSVMLWESFTNVRPLCTDIKLQ